MWGESVKKLFGVFPPNLVWVWGGVSDQGKQLFSPWASVVKSILQQRNWAGLVVKLFFLETSQPSEYSYCSSRASSSRSSPVVSSCLPPHALGMLSCSAVTCWDGVMCFTILCMYHVLLSPYKSSTNVLTDCFCVNPSNCLTESRAEAMSILKAFVLLHEKHIAFQLLLFPLGVLLWPGLHMFPGAIYVVY